MRDSINYRRVYHGTEEFGALQDFAESFDHKIIEHPNISVFAHFKGKKLFGYSDHVFLPTIYPAFHPEHTTPRDVIQVMSDWRMHCQLANSPGYLAVPFNNDNGQGNFTESKMQKLGLIRLHRELYYPS
jgi:hypothetical protein